MPGLLNVDYIHRCVTTTVANVFFFFFFRFRKLWWASAPRWPWGVPGSQGTGRGALRTGTAWSSPQAGGLFRPARPRSHPGEASRVLNAPCCHLRLFLFWIWGRSFLPGPSARPASLSLRVPVLEGVGGWQSLGKAERPGEAGGGWRRPARVTQWGRTSPVARAGGRVWTEVGCSRSGVLFGPLLGRTKRGLGCWPVPERGPPLNSTVDCKLSDGRSSHFPKAQPQSQETFG